ncbi:MAG: ABC transporter ATP-binding protein [Thermosynechococcaceae cyanobacterium]
MIEVEHLSKTYGSTTAIKDLSFKAEPGEILGLLGPNGAGKTTTMRILAGYLPATQGEARIAGYEVHENPMAVRRRIGYLPETPPLYLDMTVEGYLYFVSRIKGVPAGERTKKVTLAIERCNLLKKRRVLIHKLSKGFRQRVGIAQAIVHDPPAIILDEPTVGLDPRQIIDVRNLIKTLAEDKTVLLSTHILPEVSMTCHRAVIINHGEVVAVDTLEDLMAQRTGGIVYDLEVQALPEEVGTRLRHLDGLKMMKQLGEPNTERQQVQITTTTGVELGPQIAATLIESGIELYEMRRVTKSLEDIFLNLTTEEQVPSDEADLDEEDS